MRIYLTSALLGALAVICGPDPAAAQVLDMQLPPVATTRADAPLVLSSATFDAPSIVGVLAPDESLRVSVSAGTVTLADAAIALLDGPPDPSSVTFVGPGAGDALDGLTIEPPAGFAGGLELQLELLGPTPRSARLTIAVNAPLQADDARAALLEGVGSLHGGVQPGHMVAFGADAADIAFYPGGAASGPMVTAARWGAGRVVAMGDHQALNMHAYGGPEGGDSGALYHNALSWLASGDGRAAQVVTTDPLVGAWLGDQGYAGVRVVAVAELAEALDGADVLVPPWLGTQPPPAALAAIGDFVRAGGGLLICEYGIGWDWWWGRPKPEATGNRLLRQAGIAFVGGNRPEQGTLAIEPASGRMAADDLLALLAGVGPDAALRARAGVLMSRIFDGLSADDPLARRIDAAIGDAIDGVSPTPATPVSDPWDKALLDREDARLRDLPPERIEAHRTAEALYGAVPQDAERRLGRVTIDPATTRWHATGRYAPPGEVIEVEMPGDVLDRGFRVLINGHTDNMAPRETWLRPPRVHWNAALDQPRVAIASPFGGTIYIDVGTDARELPPFEVFVHGGVEQPWFVLGRDTDDDWQVSRALPGPYAELQSPRLSISLPSSMIRDVGSAEALMAFWDRVVEAQDAIGRHSGLRTAGERINIDVQVAYGYLHAGYPTQGPLVAGPELADVETLGRRGSWGWFHELGHEAQRRPDKSWGWDNPFTFDGSVEATVNIFTTYAMHALELRAEGGWSWTNDRVATMRRALAGLDEGSYAAVGVGYKLAMFLQLRDGFGWDVIGEALGTYQDGPVPRGDADERDAWLVRASTAAGHDLSRFMGDIWGLQFSDDARATVAPLPDWLPAMGTVSGPFGAVPGVPLRIDVGGSALSHDGVARVELDTPPAHGALAGPVDGVFTYTAEGGYMGPDALRYAVVSSTGHRVVDEVTLDVRDTGVTLERWLGIPGEAVDDLRADPRFPDAPDEIRVLAGTAMPADQGDAYGARMRGHLVAPADGDYVFWIASDDNGELWLSSDHRLDDLARIAHVPGWSGAEQWDRFPEQRSAPVTLRGGHAYAFEALMKEGAGGDHLAVAWAPVTPDGPGEPTVIAAESVRPWRAVNVPPVVRDGARTVPPDLVSLIEVSASDADGDRLHVISAEVDRGALTVDGMTLSYTPPPGYEGPATVDVVIGDGHGGEARGQIRVTVFEPLRVEPIAPLDGWIGGDCLRFDWASVPGGQADDFTLIWQRGGVTERHPVGERGPFELCEPVGDGPLVWSVEAARRGDPRTVVSPGGAVMVDQTGPQLDRDLIEPPEAASCVPGPLTIRWPAAEDAGAGLADMPYTLELVGPAARRVVTDELSVTWDGPLPPGDYFWSLTVVDRLGNDFVYDGFFQNDCTPPPLPARWSGMVYGSHTVDAPLDTGVDGSAAGAASLWMSGALCFTADRACDPPPDPVSCSGPLGADPLNPADVPAFDELPFGALLIGGRDGWTQPLEADPRTGEYVGGQGRGPLQFAVNSAAPSGCRTPGYAVTVVASPGAATIRPVDGQVLADARPALTFTGWPEDYGPAVEDQVGVWLDGQRLGGAELLGRSSASTLRLEADLAEGRHTWHVVIADGAGNIARTEPSEFIVDLSPPTEPIITQPADDDDWPEGPVELCWQRSNDVGGVDHYRVRAGGAQVVVEQTADGSDPCIAFDRPADADCIEVEAYDRVGYTALASRCLQRAPIEPDGGPDDMGPDDMGPVDMAEPDMAEPDMAYDMAAYDMAGDGMAPGAEPEAPNTSSGGCGVDPGRLPTQWPLLLIGLLATRLRR